MESALELDTTLLKLSGEILENGIFGGKRTREFNSVFDGFFSKHIIEAFKQISNKNLLNVHPKVGETLCKVVVQIITHRDFLKYACKSDVVRLCFLSKALLDAIFHMDKNEQVEGFVEIWTRTIITLLNCIGIFIKGVTEVFIKDIYKSLMDITAVSENVGDNVHSSFWGYFKAIERHAGTHLKGVKVVSNDLSVRIFITLLFHIQNNFYGYINSRAGEILTKICLQTKAEMICTILRGIARFNLSGRAIENLLKLADKSLSSNAVEMLVRIIYKHIDRITIKNLMDFLEKVYPAPPHLYPLLLGYKLDSHQKNDNSDSNISIPINVFKRLKKIINWCAILDYLINAKKFDPDISLGISIYGLDYINTMHFDKYLELYLRDGPTLDVIASVFHVILHHNSERLIQCIVEILKKDKIDRMVREAMCIVLAVSGYNVKEKFKYGEDGEDKSKLVEYLDWRLNSHLNYKEVGFELDIEPTRSNYSVPMYSGREYVDRLARNRGKYKICGYVLEPDTANKINTVSDFKESNLSDFFKKTIFLHSNHEVQRLMSVTLDGKCGIVSAPLTLFGMVQIDLNSLAKLSELSNNHNSIRRKISFDDILSEKYGRSCYGDVESLLFLSQLCYQAGSTLSSLIFRVSGYKTYKSLVNQKGDDSKKKIRYPYNHLLLDVEKPFPRLQYIFRLINNECMLDESIQEIIIKGRSQSEKSMPISEFSSVFHYLIINTSIDNEDIVKMIDKCSLGINEDTILLSLFPVFSKIMIDSVYGDVPQTSKNLENYVKRIQAVMKSRGLDVDFWDVVFLPILDLINGLATMNPLYYPALSILLRDKFQLNTPNGPCEYVKCGCVNESKIKYNSPISEKFAMCNCHSLYNVKRALKILGHFIEVSKEVVNKFAYSIVGVLDQVLANNNDDNELYNLVSDIFITMEKYITMNQGLAINYWRQMLTRSEFLEEKYITFAMVTESLLASSGNEYELIALTQQLLWIIRNNPSIILQEGTNNCISIRCILYRLLMGGVRKGRLSRNILLLLGLLPGDDISSLPQLLNKEMKERDEWNYNSKGGGNIIILPEVTQLAHYLLTNVIAPHITTKVGILTAQRILSFLGYCEGTDTMYPGCNIGVAQRFDVYFGFLPQLKPFITSQYQCTKDLDIDTNALRVSAETDMQYFIWWLLHLLPQNHSDDKNGSKMVELFRCCDLGMCEIPKLASNLLPRIVSTIDATLISEIKNVATNLLRSILKERKSIIHVRALLDIISSSTIDITTILLQAEALIYCGEYARGVYLLEHMLTYKPNSFNFSNPIISLSGSTGECAISLLARAYRSIGDIPSTLTLLALTDKVDRERELVRLVLENKPMEALVSYQAANTNSMMNSLVAHSFIFFRIGQMLPLEYAGLFFNILPKNANLTNYSKGDALKACWRLRNWDLMESLVNENVVEEKVKKTLDSNRGWLDVLCDDAVDREFKANCACILLDLRKGNEDQSIFAKALDDLFEPISYSIWECSDSSSSESDGFSLGKLLGKLKLIGSAYIVRGVLKDIKLVDNLFTKYKNEVVPFLGVAFECIGNVSEYIQLSLKYGCLESIRDLHQLVIGIEYQLPPELVSDVTCQYGCYLIDSSTHNESENVHRGLAILEKLYENGKETHASREYVYRCGRLNALHPNVTIPLFKQVMNSNKTILEYAKYLDSLIDMKLSNAYAVKIVDVGGSQKLVGLTGVTAGMSFLQLLEETFKMYIQSLTNCINDHCSLIFILNRLISLACIFCTPRNRDLYQNIWFDDVCCSFFYNTIIRVFHNLALSSSDRSVGSWYNVLPQLVSRSRHVLLGKSLFQPIIRKVIMLLPRHSFWHTLHRQGIEHCHDELIPIYTQYVCLFNELTALAMDSNVYRDGQSCEIKKRYVRLWDLFQNPNFISAALVSPTSTQMTFSMAMTLQYSGEDDYIASLCNEFQILPSKQRPKRIAWVTKKGFIHSWLIKHESKGDLRKDSRMIEIVAHANELSGTTVPTFSVFLLSEKCGVIEWIENMQSFGSAVREDLKQLELNERKIRELQKRYIKFVTNGEFFHSYHIFIDEILPLIPPVLHRVYMHWFGNDPLKWYRNRKSYTHSIAMWSILGFIVGLGDRHGDNLLISKATGQVMHVDFDCLFGKGLKLSIPEIVPFRLTQNVISGMGICGVMNESPFTQHALHVLGMLRRERKHLMSILLCFVFDPLIEWERIGKDSGVETGQCVTRQIEHKLKGAVNFTCLTSNSQINTHSTISEPAAQGLEPNKQLELLVNAATSNHNLSRMFVGWAPWL